MRAALVCLAGCVLAANLNADSNQQVDIPSRAKGAEQVVVARVADVYASFATTRHGDQIIMSDVRLEVEETLKGVHSPFLSVDVEGGTVGNLTLNVSDMPSISEGERAVFFLERSAAGKHVPHLRGQGIIKLESDGRVRGTSLTLESIRTMVRGAQR